MDSLCDIVINAETLESAPIHPTLQSGASAADLSLRIVYLGARAQRYSHFHEISEQTHKGTFKENSMNPPPYLWHWKFTRNPFPGDPYQLDHDALDLSQAGNWALKKMLEIHRQINEVAI